MMPTLVALSFRAEIEALARRLQSVSPDLADTPWKPGKWTRKQIVGHLLDSASNNRQRFVRAALDGVYAGPGYAQDGWVAVHGYADQPWEVLLEWWRVEHQILAAVVERISEDRLQVVCTVGDYAPVTLEFLISDYVAHQQWHMQQIDGQGPAARP
jgi:DinB superfamily